MRARVRRRSRQANHKKIVLLVFIVLIFGAFFVINNKNVTKQNISINTKNTYIIQESIEKGILEDETLTFDNCDYKYTDGGNLELREYTGQANTIVIPKEIDEKIVESISAETFKNSEQLEIIKVPFEMSNNIDEIEDFEKNEILSDDEYIVYSTTKQYNEVYLDYMELAEEEKANVEIIPKKFISNSILDDTQIKTASEIDLIPTRFDLRDEMTIKVENQVDTGICYAYATIKSIETNIALKDSSKKNNPENFSEIHMAGLSRQGYGGNFDTVKSNYLNMGYGPVDETNWFQEDLFLNRDDGGVKENLYNYVRTSNVELTDETVEELLKDVPQYYVMKTTIFPTVYLSYNRAYRETCKNLVKDYIRENGAVYATIISPDFGGVCFENGDFTVMNTSETIAQNSFLLNAHSINIIGWDDEFSPDNFPEEIRPNSKGAFLALNSWGADDEYINPWRLGLSASYWQKGNKDDEGRRDGTFWISYEDSCIFADINGVELVNKGKVNIENDENVEIILEETQYEYNGQERRPEIVLKYYDEEYIEGTDYSIEYVNNVNIGEASVVIKGLGRFDGEVTVPFNIIGLNVEIEEYNLEENDEIIYIREILEGTTLEEFERKIKTNGNIKVYDNSVEILNKEEKIKTGLKLDIEKGEEKVEYELVVIGDVTGDGKVNGADLLKIARYIAELENNLQGTYLKAANVQEDSENTNQINTVDLLKIARVLIGMEQWRR